MLLLHLSASMCQKHRKDVLARLSNALERKDKLICVSTQVIEAGIDISFSRVFRFAAGLESIVQSAGRCNRNGEVLYPQPVYILKVQDESLKGLSEIQEGKIALLNLVEEFYKDPCDFNNDLSSKKATNYYYNVLFGSQSCGIQDYPNPQKGRPTLFSLLSDNSDILNNGTKKEGSEEYIYRQSFKEAGAQFSVFDNNQKTVIVPYSEEGQNLIATLQTKTILEDFGHKKRTIEKAKDYSVNIFDYLFNHLCDLGAIVFIEELGVYCLRREYYGETGVTDKEENECDTLIL